MAEKEHIEFPFYTCEKINKHGVAQPFSTVVNITTSCILLYYAITAKTMHAKMAILGIFMVEVFHTFSHTIHIPGTFQRNGIHFLTYISDLLLLWALSKNTGIVPETWFIILFVCLIGIDMYAVTHFSLVVYLMTNGILFATILFYYYRSLAKSIQKMILPILAIAALGIALFYNETINCKAMMDMIPGFPFHIIIEFVNMVLFTLLGMTFSQL